MNLENLEPLTIRRAFVDGPFGQVHLRRALPQEQSAHLPLLCLHQSPKSSREFRKFMSAPALARDVIAIDAPGHGESDIPKQASDASLENYARSHFAVLDALGIERFDILGNHTGAKVATEMAVQQPKRVGKIVMISALVLNEVEREGFKSLFTPIPLDPEGTRFKTLWERAIHYRGPGVSLEDLAASFAESLRAGEAYEWGHQAAFDYNVHFAARVKSLPHRITVLNPGDMLFEHTPRIGPLLQNGQVIDHPEWGIGFLDAYTDDAVKAVISALG